MDEQNTVQNSEINEHMELQDSNTYYQPTVPNTSLSDAQPSMAPSETIQDAVDAEFVEGPSALVIEEPSTTSPPTRAQAEATYSPDVTMEIPDSSQVSLLSSPYEERNLTSDAGYTSTSHEANLPAVTEHAQEEQTEGQSRDDQPSQDSSKSESQIDPHSSSQLDIVQQPSGSTPNLLEPPKDKRIAALEARKTSLEATLANLTATRDTLASQFSALPSISPTLTFHSHAPTPTPASPSHRASSPPSALPSSSPSTTPQPDSDSNAAVLAAAKAVIKRHITLLHDYNEIRDVGLGLMGLIADARGVRIKDVQEEFGIEAKD
ncbi:hypothetical protein H2201_008112 [Coniosporium apollinis]|uniref:DNA repair protein Swi5/Sae3 n=1 Tax=Coniosporium apollinis TaxID=61459 RepID=A0ABQ9NJJ6_9PEZI|nr:hypothetical protein H2201_008112 [Coniosporium apollinis]